MRTLRIYSLLANFGLLEREEKGWQIILQGSKQMNSECWTTELASVPSQEHEKIIWIKNQNQM